MSRPQLHKQLDETVFLDFYYLKEELIAFCKAEGLSATDSKEVLTHRIAHFLKTGEKLAAQKKARVKPEIGQLTLETLIEENFVCSEIHRAFFKEQLGNSFSFNVKFQQWLKANGGKTYQEALIAYGQILAEKKQKGTVIDKQFEYNTYIRDFFEANKGASLAQAIQCWKYKKSLAGHNKYEEEDLQIL